MTSDLINKQDVALQSALNKQYPHGFVTDIETEKFAHGLTEEVVRAIPRKKMNQSFIRI